MRNHFRFIAVVAAGLSLTACAQRPREQPVWNPTPTATIPQNQAAAKCEFSIKQNGAAFDQLSMMAGQPMLNEYGRSLYRDCMLGQGYEFGGTVPVPGGAS